MTLPLSKETLIQEYTDIFSRLTLESDGKLPIKGIPNLITALLNKIKLPCIGENEVKKIENRYINFSHLKISDCGPILGDAVGLSLRSHIFIQLETIFQRYDSGLKKKMDKENITKVFENLEKRKSNKKLDKSWFPAIFKELNECEKKEWIFEDCLNFLCAIIGDEIEKCFINNGENQKTVIDTEKEKINTENNKQSEDINAKSKNQNLKEEKENLNPKIIKTAEKFEGNDNDLITDSQDFQKNNEKKEYNNNDNNNDNNNKYKNNTQEKNWECQPDTTLQNEKVEKTNIEINNDNWNNKSSESDKERQFIVNKDNKETIDNKYNYNDGIEKNEENLKDDDLIVTKNDDYVEKKENLPNEKLNQNNEGESYLDSLD